MRVRLGAAAAGIAIMAGLVALIGVTRYATLVSRALSIGRPVHVTALAAHVRAGGKQNVRVTVDFATPQGRAEVRLPSQLQHSPETYAPPVRLVYDRDDPQRVMLAADWNYGRTGRAAVLLWLSVAVLSLDVLALLVWLGRLAWCRRRRTRS